MQRKNGMVTTAYVARRCGVTQMTALRWAKADNVEAIKIGGRLYIRLHSLLKAKPELRFVFEATGERVD